MAFGQVGGKLRPNMCSKICRAWSQGSPRFSLNYANNYRFSHSFGCFSQGRENGHNLC